MKATVFRTQVGRFLRDESGAVTTDWVILTAGVAFLAIGVVAMISPANDSVAARIGAQIDAVQPYTGGN